MAKLLTPYQQAALYYNKHIALTANAGSGKTFVLSKRYVDIALKEKISLRKIIAITFTDKAAGELNKRIAGEVDERLAVESNPANIKTLEKMRRQLVSANISTIHSFCIEVLKEFSPEAGLDANFVSIDQTTADELIDLSIEETITHLLTSDTEFDVKELIRFFGSKKILSIELKRLIKNRNPILDVEQKLYTRSKKDIALFFRAIFESKFKTLFLDNVSIIKSELTEINDHVLIVKPGNETALVLSGIINKLNPDLHPFEFLELINQINEAMFTKSGEVRAQGYLAKSERDEISSIIFKVENFIKEISKFEIPNEPDVIEESLADIGKRIINIFRLIDDDYTERKDQRGYLDFEDILMHTKKIINNPEVQKYLSSNYKFVMIDEYQDTNEIQYEIFMPILDNLKSGNLFVVGDEKQSIYMFRDADIKIFLRTKKEIEAAANKEGILSLPHSFRVAPSIAAFTNVLFEELFKNPDFELNEVEHSSLVCAKPQSTAGNIELLIADGEGDLEADLVSKKILNILSEKKSEFGLNDIAILCRKRSAFAELEKSLSAFGIPHSVVAGKGFYQKQIVNDVFNYLSFLVNPDDDTSLVGILRSPFFTLSDKEIFVISLQKGKNLFAKFSNYCIENEKRKSVLEILNRHISLSKRSEFSFILRKIISETTYLPVIAARENYKQEIGNLEKLFSLAKSFEQQGFKSLYDFVDYLKKSIQTLEDEGQASINNDEQSVKIMTIHQAKGLEFNSVILFRCSDTSEENKIKSRSLAVDKEFGILTKVPNGQNYFEDFLSPPINSIYNYVTHRKNIAELKRLLYVGITRAVQNLIITGSTNKGNAKKDSFLHLISSGLNMDLESESYTVSTELEFMELKNENFEFNERDIEFDIPILKSIERKENVYQFKESAPVVNTEFYVEALIDKSEHEIISATKLAVYTQCPLKYKLTYEYGFSEINSIFELSKTDNAVSEHQFQLNEDEEYTGYSDIRGRIIHKILDENVSEHELTKRIAELLDKEFVNKPIVKNVVHDIRESIENNLRKFYASNIYKELSAYNNFNNEHEVYLRLNDYYLFGIIDKLIFDKENVIIVDYKTDNISADQLNARGELYLSQLKFYAVIVSEIYKLNHIEIKIIFTKFPETTFNKIISSNEIIEFKDHINNVVNSIRNDYYPPNLNHCIKCHYAVDEKNCVKGIT
jgi:ATP-dependent helicase/nuclease subunit A